MKVMISQPMRGKTKEQILEEREHAVKLLEKEGHEVVESFIDPESYAANGPVWCMARSIDVMSACDAVCFIGDWREARGCRIEHAVAEEYGLWVMMI